MTVRIAAFAASVTIAVAVGCRPSNPADSDVPTDGDRESGSAQVDSPASHAWPADEALDADALSDDDLVDRIERLHDFVVPPVGASRASVDFVYGDSKVIEALRAGGKGYPGAYPMHAYELLPPIGRAEFRAVLYVTFRNDKVAQAGINHHCVIKGRRAGPLPAREERSIRAEQQRVLLDLLEIRRKFGGGLGTAGWKR